MASSPRAALFLLLLVAPTWASAGSGATDEGLRSEPHPSVWIEGDAGFAAPGSGVRGGSGTLEDPYRIARWLIVEHRSAGITLVGTRAHVVIEEVQIGGVEGFVTAHSDCVLDPGSGCPGPRGVDLLDAENVTMRDVRVVSGTFGLRIRGASSLLVEGVTLGLRVPYPGFSMVNAIDMEDSSDVTLRDVSVAGSLTPLRVVRSHAVTIEGSSFIGSGENALVYASGGVRIDASTLSGVRLLLSGLVVGLDIRHSVFTGPALVVAGSGNGLQQAVLCRNLFRDAPGDAVHIRSGADIVVLGNRFERNGVAADIDGSRRVRFEHNLVRASSTFGVFLGNLESTTHNNSFVDNPGGHHVTYGDARYDWWGDPSGPSGDGPGTGDPLYTGFGKVPFAPWLTVPPDLDVSCPAFAVMP